MKCKTKTKKFLTAISALTLLTLFLSSAFADITIPKRPIYFPFNNGAYLTFDTSILPLTFSGNPQSVYRDTINKWHFGNVWLRSTATMTVTAWFSDNWLNYTVASSGTQEIYNGSKPSMVYIDGYAKTEGDGWSYSEGTVTVTSSSSSTSLYWGNTTVESSGDSYVNVYYPNNNYGSSSTLYSGVWGIYTWNTWLKFDLSFLPTNTIILSATLNLKASAVTAPNPPTEWPILHVYFCSDDSWNESSITWNNQPSYDGLLDSKQLTGTGWSSWNITSSALTEYSGDKIVSFCLNTTQIQSYASFYSEENVDTNRPYLTINYFVNALGAWTPYYTPSSHLIDRNLEPYLYFNASTQTITTNSPTFEVANNGTYILSPMQGIIQGARTWNLANGTNLLWWEGGYNSVGPSPANGSSQQYYWANGLGPAYWLDTDLIWDKDYGYKLVKYTNGSLYANNLWKMTETIMALDTGYSWVQLIEVEFQSGISSYPNGSIAHTFIPMMGDQQNNNGTFDVANNCFVIDSKNNPFRIYIGSNVSISNWALNSSWGTWGVDQSGLQADYGIDGCFSNTNTDLGNGTFAGFQFNYTNAYSGQKLLFPIIHTYTNKSLVDGGLSLYANIKNNLETELSSVKTNFYNFMDTSPVLYSSNQNLNDLWYWNLAKTYRITVKTGSGSLVLNSPFAYGDFFGTSCNLGFGSYVEELLANNHADIAKDILNAFLQSQFINGHIPHDLIVNNSVNTVVYPPGLSELADGLACWLSAISRYYLWTNDSAFIADNWLQIGLATARLYERLQLPENLVNETGANQFWDTLIGRNGFTLWTNAYAYDAFHMLSLMAAQMGYPTVSANASAIATNISGGIQTYLWDGTLGYFKGFYNGTYSGGEYDASGNMLAMVFSIATDTQKASILSKAWQVGALQAFPIRTITPSYPASMDSQNWQYRENGGIFPMVSSWWAYNEFQENNASYALGVLEQIYQRTILNLTGGYIVGSLEHYNQTTGEPTGANQAYGEVWEEVPMTQAILQGMIGVTVGENVILKPFVPSEILSLNLTNIALRGTPLNIAFSLGGFVVDDANPVPMWDFYVDDELKAAGVTSFDLSVYLDGQPHEIIIVSLHPPNHPPENVDVEITDMDMGNWVISKTKYYSFQAKFQDLEGYGDFSECSVAFTDGLNWVNMTYNFTTKVFRLDNGTDIVVLRSGTLSTIDVNNIQVTFLIYIESTIQDAENVSLYMYCIDSHGAYDGWEIMRADYFNIYNLGGLSTLETSGNAGRLAGGSVFDLYAYNSSWVESTIMFRNLQHAKFLPTFQFKLLAINPSRLLTYDLMYKIGTDDFVTAIRVRIGWWNSSSDPRYTCFQVVWMNSHLSQVKVDYIFMFMNDEAYAETNQTVIFWVDLWIGQENASSVAGGRVNAYWFPIQDNSNSWLRWITGSNWGLYEARKQSMFTTTITDSDGLNIIHSQQIEMMKLRCRVEQGLVTQANPLFKVSEYDVFDLTFCHDPFVGIQTPPFDESRMPQMNQGGFLGSVWSAIQNGFNFISNSLGLSTLFADAWTGLSSAFWDFFPIFAGWMDAVFAAAGYPGAFTAFTNWLGSAWAWLIASITYSISLMTSFFSFISTFMTQLLSFISEAFQLWGTIFTAVGSFLAGGYGTGVNIWTTYNVPQWITLGLILYPIYLVFLWEEEGLGAVINQITFIYNTLHLLIYVFLTIIHYVSSMISRLLESIPVAE